MKQQRHLVLGLLFLVSVGLGYSIPAHAQIELTCREGQPGPKEVASVLLTFSDCLAALKRFGVLQEPTQFFVGDSLNQSLVVGSLPGSPEFTCFLTNEGVSVVGPVDNRFDRTCPDIRGGEPDPGNGCGDGFFAWDPALGCDPIIFDFGERGFDLTGIDDGVRFDIDADGALEQVAWTAAGSDDAFLALDRNGNGEIDDGSELFGNVTVLGDGSTAAHGYVALTELDFEANGGNENDYVDHRDRDFSKLLLWTDRDHDGEATRDELIGLRERGVFAIALDADESDVIDEHGNRLAFVSPAYAWRRFRVERIRTTDVFLPYRELAP
jgi:hypothetical protein